MSKQMIELVCFCLCVSLTSAVTLAGEKYQNTTTIQCVSLVEQEAVSPLVQKLNEPMGVNFDAHKLETTLNHWKEVTGIDLLVNWVDLCNVGIDQDMPITLKIKDIPAGEMLDLILEQAAQNNPLDPIMHQENHGLIQIATKNYFLKKSYLVTYELKKLQEANVLDEPNEFESLKNVIRSHIEPKTWKENGGSHASISSFKDKLLITAPRFMHQLIVSLCQNLFDESIPKITAGNLNKIINADFESHKLADVLDYIATESGIDININWIAMVNVGVENDMPITLQLKNATVAQVLDMVLQNASANNELDPVWYDVIENRIYISTQRDILRKNMQVTVYDITDMLDRAAQLDRTTLEDSTTINQRKSTRINEILELVRTQTGRQHDWVEFGGDCALASEFNGMLIVKAHPSIQKQIQKLIADIRMQKPRQKVVSTAK